jgi:hypothetical protein
VEGKLE